MQIHQFCAGFAIGDAISNEALVLQEFLRSLGLESRIYTQHFSDQEADYVHHYREFRDRSGSILIYHHSFHSDFLPTLPQLKSRLVLVYHNTTPVQFVAPYNRKIADRLQKTRELLAKYHNLFELNLAASRFNARDLESLGFRDIAILPVPLQSRLKQKHDAKEDALPALEFLNDGRRNILFVGRIFPNKRHQDLLKTFYYYQKIKPESRLCIVGDFHPGMKGYTAELVNLSRALGIHSHVLFTGMVSASQLRRYYENSHLFLSMSEHEGFFVPLVESMHLNLPVLAYRAAVVPETLGDCGVTFTRKDHPRIAALMHSIIENNIIRDQIIAGQKKRCSSFDDLSTIDAFQRGLIKIGIQFPGQ
ncbi:MAG: glycosyltransferase [Leptospiraceae bacterium]|nr:glycosyltransferase [Leptospiraceae bacterium]